MRAPHAHSNHRLTIKLPAQFPSNAYAARSRKTFNENPPPVDHATSTKATPHEQQTRCVVIGLNINTIVRQILNDAPIDPQATTPKNLYI